MHVWHKTLLTVRGEAASVDLDRTFADHARAMGRYECHGYGSTAEFFATHFDASRRLRHYDTFLAAHLQKGARTLSIASGRAANEMRLAEQGYDIVCSDLEPVCPEPTRALFPGYRFVRWDVLNDAVPADRFDAVMCLSFVYLLAPAQLDRFFERVSAVLAPGGTFILDSAGAPDSRLANAFHDVVLPIDARLTCAMVNLRARATGRPSRYVVTRKHHGYRYRDDEYVEAGRRHGFALEAVSHMDFENEWTRMYLYRFALSRVPLIKAALLRIGRSMPYVRMFAFRRAA